MNDKRIFNALLICFSVSLAGCNSDDSSEMDMDKEVELNVWKTYRGSGDSKKYDIGIIFEAREDEPMEKTYRSLLDRIVGDGSFSLYRTSPFDQNKDKFNVHYAVISKSEDADRIGYYDAANKFVAYTNEDILSFRKKADEYIISNKAELDNITSLASLDRFLNKLGIAIELDMDKTLFYYADGAKYEHGGDIGREQLEIIKKNIKRFDDVFKRKELDLEVYISSGIGTDYTSVKSGGSTRRKIFMSYHDYVLSNFIIRSELSHPDVFAGIFTHEFGHAFCLFSDEYYEYDDDPDYNTSTKFENNTIYNGYEFKGIIFDSRDGDTYPWLADSVPILTSRNLQGDYVTEFIKGPVPSFKVADLVEGGPGGNGYRTSENSVMRKYAAFSESQWRDESWNPVHKFYINHFLQQY